MSVLLPTHHQNLLVVSTQKPKNLKRCGFVYIKSPLVKWVGEYLNMYKQYNIPGTQMTLVLIGVWALLWRVDLQNRGQLDSGYTNTVMENAKHWEVFFETTLSNLADCRCATLAWGKAYINLYIQINRTGATRKSIQILHILILVEFSCSF